MKEALNFAIEKTRSNPFAAIIVNAYTNVVSCYGYNNSTQYKLLHAEMAAYANCTALFPSPTGDDNLNPGLRWSNQTLYTTAESCPMCAQGGIYRGVGRVVYGTSIPTLVKIGSHQTMIRQADLYRASVLNMYGTGSHGNVPLLKGGVLVNDTDAVFFASKNLPYPPPGNPDEDVFNEPFW